MRARSRFIVTTTLPTEPTITANTSTPTIVSTISNKKLARVERKTSTANFDFDEHSTKKMSIYFSDFQAEKLFKTQR